MVGLLVLELLCEGRGSSGCSPVLRDICVSLKRVFMIIVVCRVDRDLHDEGGIVAVYMRSAWPHIRHSRLAPPETIL